MVEQSNILSNKPLVESIFEIRWRLDKLRSGMLVDPHYKLLVGRVYDKLESDYPFHKSLPTAGMPDEISANVVQHQFRNGVDGWPLVQIGPGVATLNDTEQYEWPDFRARVIKLLDVLFDCYLSKQNSFAIHSLLLRYIDAEPFDFASYNIWEFLEDKLKLKVKVSESLFESTGVDELPFAFDLRFTFPSSQPPGATHLRFVRGTKNGKDALIWETHVQSKGDHVPASRDDLAPWVDAAHQITHDWFFKMIDGDLREKYQ